MAEARVGWQITFPENVRLRFELRTDEYSSAAEAMSDLGRTSRILVYAGCRFFRAAEHHDEGRNASRASWNDDLRMYQLRRDAMLTGSFMRHRFRAAGIRQKPLSRASSRHVILPPSSSTAARTAPRSDAYLSKARHASAAFRRLSARLRFRD